jgi:DNA polymerase epsilon subunit 2
MGAAERNIKVVNHVHAVLGSAERKWVLGIMTQKEDSNYYLEDSTFTVKISFAELEYVEQDAFFTEMCVILAEGKYLNGTFYLLRAMHPPLHANKKLKFQLNEQDYFGSYTKMTENMMF